MLKGPLAAKEATLSSAALGLASARPQLAILARKPDFYHSLATAKVTCQSV